jgi:hypothetical protein
MSKKLDAKAEALQALMSRRYPDVTLIAYVDYNTTNPTLSLYIEADRTMRTVYLPDLAPSVEIRAIADNEIREVLDEARAALAGVNA